MAHLDAGLGEPDPLERSRKEDQRFGVGLRTSDPQELHPGLIQFARHARAGLPGAEDGTVVAEPGGSGQRVRTRGVEPGDLRGDIGPDDHHLAGARLHELERVGERRGRQAPLDRLEPFQRGQEEAPVPEAGEDLVQAGGELGEVGGVVGEELAQAEGEREIGRASCRERVYSNV